MGLFLFKMSKLFFFFFRVLNLNLIEWILIAINHKQKLFWVLNILSIWRYPNYIFFNLNQQTIFFWLCQCFSFSWEFYHELNSKVKLYPFKKIRKVFLWELSIHLPNIFVFLQSVRPGIKHVVKLMWASFSFTQMFLITL